MSALLRFQDVTYRYPGVADPALEQVSFQLQPGEFCVLAGLSGHGKSTVLRAACGLVPHFHGGSFAGEIVVAGRDLRNHGPALLGQVAGALFQDPETQLVTSTVRAEIALTLESRGQSSGEVARGVEEVALALGIDHLLDRGTYELSGGEKQRVALAAAIAARPPLILLDEPTSQLDPVAGDELVGLLRRLNEEWDTTVLLAEHRLERCLHAAHRVIALERGRVVHDGSPRAFLQWSARSAPALQTPAAKLFSLAGLQPAPVGVRDARGALRRRGLLPEGEAAAAVAPQQRARGLRRADDALAMRGVWHELRDGPALLRGATLRLGRGEAIALMGRNGAGKSTLLRHAAGLLAPTRGKISRAGRVALLLQNPGDYFLHDRVRHEASPSALRAAGLAHLGDRHPRDLSGGERQRLALAIVTGEGRETSPGRAGQTREAPAVVALDEPTRGMDREDKAQLADELQRRARAGQAVIVATHDPEFAAACAHRAVLLADGRVIADGPASELLAGGWYFATETARVLGGAAGALLPEQGAELLTSRAPAREVAV
jgi:energy-coupling factor transporter ATP-binding protein EcfA2